MILSVDSVLLRVAQKASQVHLAFQSQIFALRSWPFRVMYWAQRLVLEWNGVNESFWFIALNLLKLIRHTVRVPL